MTALNDAATDPRHKIAALRRELDERTAERDEALAQQAATGEILSVISRSPADIQPVFEAIVTRAAALCEAEFSAVARLKDGLLHLVAVHSMSPEETATFHSLFPRPPARNFTMGRAFVDARPVHFGDVLSELDYDTRTFELLQSVAKYSSFLGVPILREGRPIGVIGCGRREDKPFTAAQIELVKTFADQAVIAIENTRLITETRRSNLALRENEERYALVTQAVAEGIYEWNIQSNSLWVSSRLIEIFGLAERGLTAADWNSLVHPEDFPLYRSALRACFKGVTARLDCEYRVRRRPYRHQLPQGSRRGPTRGARPADRDRANSGGHQPLTGRFGAGLRGDGRAGGAAVRSRRGGGAQLRRQAAPPRRRAWRTRCPREVARTRSKRSEPTGSTGWPV
jgi:PAS domain-containing protein